MIKLNNLTIGHNKHKPLTSNINYTFESGKIYGLIGKSGSGKTTLLRTICGLHKPISGHVTLDGNHIKHMKPNGMYMMHQNYANFDWLTCINNILISLKIEDGHVSDQDKTNAYNALDVVGLKEFANYFPSQLSGGMKQRLALARTIVTLPKIMLMDEPLSALDSETRDKMHNILLDMHARTSNTMIIITHSAEEANKLCDHLISINEIGETK